MTDKKEIVVQRLECHVCGKPVSRKINAGLYCPRCATEMLALLSDQDRKAVRWAPMANEGQWPWPHNAP